MIISTHRPTRRRIHPSEAPSTGTIFGEQHVTKIDDRRLLLVLMLIEASLPRQLAIGDLAEAVNLSSSRLAHLFKNEIGVSPQRYLNNVRLEKARELLENGLLSVKEIAAEVGFPNVSCFCRSFKLRYGTTPREYRQTNFRIEPQRLQLSRVSV